MHFRVVVTVNRVEMTGMSMIKMFLTNTQFVMSVFMCMRRMMIKDIGESMRVVCFIERNKREESQENCSFHYLSCDVELYRAMDVQFGIF